MRHLAIALLAALALTPSSAPAQTRAPAIGADMWTSEMGRLGLFVPHGNNCAPATEFFVPVGPSGRGFCIEKAERPADEWERARHTCLQLGKRLPEVAEWQMACVVDVGFQLLDMFNGFEWSSNFLAGHAPSEFQLRVYASGGLASGNCNGGFSAIVANSNGPGSANSWAFRCVR